MQGPRGCNELRTLKESKDGINVHTNAERTFIYAEKPMHRQACAPNTRPQDTECTHMLSGMCTCVDKHTHTHTCLNTQIVCRSTKSHASGWPWQRQVQMSRGCPGMQTGVLTHRQSHVCLYAHIPEMSAHSSYPGLCTPTLHTWHTHPHPHPPTHTHTEDMCKRPACAPEPQKAQ